MGTKLTQTRQKAPHPTARHKANASLIVLGLKHTAQARDGASQGILRQRLNPELKLSVPLSLLASKFDKAPMLVTPLASEILRPVPELFR